MEYPAASFFFFLSGLKSLKNIQFVNSLSPNMKDLLLNVAMKTSYYKESVVCSNSEKNKILSKCYIIKSHPHSTWFLALQKIYANKACYFKPSEACQTRYEKISSNF